MFFATGLANVFNLLYQLYMVRALSPINYGILNSLLAMLMLVSIPAGTIQTVITKFASTFHATNQPGKTKSLLTNSARKVLLFGLGLFLIVTIGSKHISSFLQIPSRMPVTIVGIIIGLSIISPVLLGGLLGLQKFRLLGLGMVTGGGLKLALGILFVSFGFKVMGALCGFAIATLVILVLSFLFLNKVFSYPGNEPIDFSEVYRYFYPVALVTLCYMVLTNADIILVKHFFKPLEAGYYSIAQMVGKIILFLPGAVVIVMFPKASDLHARNEDTTHLIKKSLTLTGLLSGTAALICFIYPSLIIRLLSGKIYLECIPLARLFAVSMTFFAMVSVFLFYHLSIGNLRFIYPFAICAVLQVILITLFHNTLSQVLYILLAIAFLLFAINLRMLKGKP